ncbi:DUF4221 family protein [Pleomorphovibrio marinus]|uniref:DUF4221 family protein n=1 Tax=Pleomorphovibrio marinus TaxID=2164132 RepID=UPI000E0A0956|nr:DUF4221 family protein [Pleomorphovibrio marinus]
MTKKIVICLSLLGICLYSCSEREKASTQLTLTQSDEGIAFEMDETSSNYSMQIEYLEEDEREYVFHRDILSQDIQCFDLQTQQLVKRLKFDQEGERGIGMLNAFFIPNLDSILIFGNQLFLTDFEGDSWEKIAVTKPDKLSRPILQKGPYRASPKFKEGHIIVATLPEGNYRDLSQEQLNQASLSYRINLYSGAVVATPHYYPDDYLSQDLKFPFFSMVSQDYKLIYSFMGDHHVYVGTPDNPSLEAIYAPSRFLPQNLPSVQRDATSEQFSQYYLSAPKYGSIYYDKYRDVFYRFVYPEYEVNDEEELRELRMYRPFFSVQILGPDLALLGETLMDQEPLNPFNAFVGKKGLYISNSNPNHPDFNEDIMSFHLFELIEEQSDQH